MSNRHRLSIPELHPLPAGAGRREVFEGFYSRFLGNHRFVTIYLPPGYDAEPQRRYPVLYLHDGQNLFDPGRAAFGVAWDADATAERLIQERRIPPLLLVGIDNTHERLDEYAYHPDPRANRRPRPTLRPLRAGRGEDVHRRPLPHAAGSPQHRRGRGVDGRADFAVDGATNTTSGFRCAGPCRRRCGGATAGCWTTSRATAAGCGGCVSGWTWARARASAAATSRRRSGGRGRLVGCFDAAGLIPGRDYLYWEVAGGEHNEAAWAVRFDKMLLYFFGR